jgi:Icc-related predicted phosphoesterase
MRIQLASDLHLEHLRDRFPGERVIAPAPDADLLVIAGDIANGVDGVRMFANWPVPVLYVVGNHESYGHELSTIRRAIREAAAGTSVLLLDNDIADLLQFAHWASSRSVELQHIRVLGCTLWTDYELPNSPLRGRRARAYAERRLSDHRAIRSAEGAAFSASDALREHSASVAWLSRELAKPFAGRTVVITHHAPHIRSVHPRYSGDPLSTAFVSHLPALTAQADLWLHGHVHDSFDFVDGRCRVVANPLGYPLNRNSALNAHDLVFENPEFRHAFVIDI